jgi:hypothetical protein
MEIETPKACLSVALCTCKIVTTKLEELRLAQIKSVAIFSRNIAWKNKQKKTEN